MISFIASTRVIVSRELAESIKETVQGERCQKLGFILDKNIERLEKVGLLVASFESEFTIYKQVLEMHEPAVNFVDEVTEYFRKNVPEILIGIGGGSTLDLTKAVSVMVTNPGRTEEYHGTSKQLKPGIKKIMVPTTAGTGSEVSPGAVLVNKKTNFKRALSGKYVTPDYAVLDAELTLSMPPLVMASTGMDALIHAIESYTARNSNVITKMFSREAFRLVYNNLKKGFEQPENIDIREKVLIGSCLAGFAIFNSNTGACHSMAYPLGIYNDIPHGLATALIMPEVMKINIEKGYYLYADLLEFVEDNAFHGSLKANSEKLLELIKILIPKDIMPKSFLKYRVNEDNYEFLAERGLDLASALNNNPVDFDIEDAKRVLRNLI